MKTAAQYARELAALLEKTGANAYQLDIDGCVAGRAPVLSGSAIAARALLAEFRRDFPEQAPEESPVVHANPYLFPNE